VCGVTALRMTTPARGPRFRRAGIRAWAAIVLIGAVGALTGCVTGPPTAPSPSAETPAVAPLRGTPIDPAEAEHPSLAVKIDNLAAARPQIGLERADLVFEELVEGGLTRYAALWHSDVPDDVGPVRSIRPMDPDLLSPFGGIVAYSGGQPQFVEAMQNTPVLNVIFDRDDSGAFRRVDDRESPHDVVLSAADLVDRHPDLAAPERQFAYADSAAAAGAATAGEAAGTIVTRFSDSSERSWTWDPAGAAYLRSQDGAPDLDADDTRLSATNVVVLSVSVDRSTDVPRTLLEGTGQAWVSANGSTLPATWTKEAPAAPIRLTDADGAAIDLAPGNTWIELVPTDGGGAVEIQP